MRRAARGRGERIVGRRPDDLGGSESRRRLGRAERAGAVEAVVVEDPVLAHGAVVLRGGWKRGAHEGKRGEGGTFRTAWFRRPESRRMRGGKQEMNREVWEQVVLIAWPMERDLAPTNMCVAVCEKYRENGAPQKIHLKNRATAPALPGRKEPKQGHSHRPGR